MKANFLNFLKKQLSMPGDARIADQNSPFYKQKLKDIVNRAGTGAHDTAYITKAELNRATGKLGVDMANERKEKAKQEQAQATGKKAKKKKPEAPIKNPLEDLAKFSDGRQMLLDAEIGQEEEGP